MYLLCIGHQNLDIIYFLCCTIKRKQMLVFESSITTRGEEMCPRVTPNCYKEENKMVLYFITI